MSTCETQAVERALQLLDARLAKSDLLTDGTVKLVPATSNVGPLGLFAFALTTALLQGQFSTVADGVSGVRSLVWGYGMFYGGLAQLIAGILEYPRKNTFGTVAFCSYGTFWMALTYFQTIQAVVNGITPQLSAANQTVLNSTVTSWTYKYASPVPNPIEGERMLLSLWGILTLLFWFCTFSMNLITSALFLSLALLFFFLAGGQPQPDHMEWMKFAGIWGFWTAALAFYDGIAALLKEVYGRQVLPVFPLKPNNKISSSPSPLELPPAIMVTAEVYGDPAGAASPAPPPLEIHQMIKKLRAVMEACRQGGYVIAGRADQAFLRAFIHMESDVQLAHFDMVTSIHANRDFEGVIEYVQGWLADRQSREAAAGGR